jgi:ribosomal protein S18 acetylase RimI-like enzyme
MSVIIREANHQDAAEIANVHINSWREAYVGLLPQEFLDDRPLFFKNRYQLWKKVTRDEEQVTFVAECSENGIVGFVNGKTARDPEYKDHAEVYAIYLLKKYHHQGLGFQLLKNYFDVFKARGFTKAYLWVLDGNPTIEFYKKAGGVYKGHSKEENLAGQKMTELCFIWDDLNLGGVI